MRPEKILFIDTETGGTDPFVNSLLSVGLVVWKEGKILGKKEILIDDGRLQVTPEALEINGIDLDKHRKKAVPPAEAVAEFDAFLLNYFGSEEKIILGGHNVNFDVNFLKYFLISHHYNFYQRFSHRYVDTASILFYLYMTERIRRKVLSSQDAFDYFGIIVEGRHTALGDAMATAELFNRLVGILYRSPKSKSTSKGTMPELF